MRSGRRYSHKMLGKYTLSFKAHLAVLKGLVGRIKMPRFIPKATHEITVNLANGELVSILDLSRPFEPLFWDQDFWRKDVAQELPKYSFDVANINGVGIRIEDFETGNFVPVVDLKRMTLLKDMRI
jgi:hypothetical protein